MGRDARMGKRCASGVESRRGRVEEAPVLSLSVCGAKEAKSSPYQAMSCSAGAGAREESVQRANRESDRGRNEHVKAA